MERNHGVIRVPGQCESGFASRGQHFVSGVRGDERALEPGLGVGITVGCCVKCVHSAPLVDAGSGVVVAEIVSDQHGAIHELHSCQIRLISNRNTLVIDCE